MEMKELLPLKSVPMQLETVYLLMTDAGLICYIRMHLVN